MKGFGKELDSGVGRELYYTEISARKFRSVNSRFALFGIDRHIMVSLTLARSGQAERRTTMNDLYVIVNTKGHVMSIPMNYADALERWQQLRIKYGQLFITKAKENRSGRK